MASKTRKTYNGHPSYNAWNVALWLGNDEGLYHFALDCKRHGGNSEQGARIFMQEFEGRKTPDGVPYTLTNVKRALAGLG